MKTLKKTLSLTLVFALVFSLMSMAFAAETTTTSTSATGFTDEASIQYKEAVDVMTGIGAINGYTDGSVKPQGSITREEAAKMITYAVLSKDIADKLSVSNTGFTDVASDRWSAPYIAYLVGKGIINGMGDGTFAPTANVTGYQMAKMMLCAAGYGAKGEFTGNGWELPVAVAANKAKVFEGAKAADFSKPATREEASLYVFNGITNVPQVQYNKLFDKYENVVFPAGHAKAGQTVKIADEIYTTLVQVSTVADGVSGYYWTYKGKVISGIVSDANVLATSTNGTTFANLTDNTKTTYIGYQDDATVTYYLNGAEVTDATEIDTAKGLAANKGVVVKFLDTSSPANGKYDVVSITNATVKTLTGDAKTTTTGAVTTVTVPGVFTGSAETKNVTGYEGLKKGDIVLYHTYTADGGAAKHVITKCATFTGTVNGVNETAKVVVVDGKQYYVSDLTGGKVVTDYPAIATVPGTTFYTDLGGNIVSFKASETISTLENTVYVLKATDNGFTYQARVLRADGKSEIITVAKTATNGGALKNVDGVVAHSEMADGKIATNVLYTAVKNADGSYNLTVSKTNTVFTTASTETIKKGQPVFATSAIATNGTVFVYYNADGTAKVYTGIANAPTYTTGASDSYVTYMTDSNDLATLVVAVGGTYDAAVAADTAYAFAFAPATTVYVDASTSYLQYKAVVNGEIKTIDMKSNKTLTLGTLTAVTAFDNGKGAATTTATSGTLLETPVADIGTFTVAGTSLLAKDKDNPATVKGYILNPEAKIFKFTPANTTNPIVEITAAELNDLVAGAYTLQAVKTSSSDSSLKTLFVTVG